MTRTPRGRPPTPPSLHHSVRLLAHLTPDEMDHVRRAFALSSYTSISAWVRRAVLAAADAAFVAQWKAHRRRTAAAMRRSRGPGAGGGAGTR